MTRRMMAAGNWKMNGLAASASEIDALIAGLKERGGAVGGVDVALCPPATLVSSFSDRSRDSQIAIGGQDCHPAASGAHTGDIAAGMLADAGATVCILGHSERRADHGETNDTVRAKAAAAIAAGLTAIVCVGETEAERDAGRALDVVATQLDGSVPTTATAETLVVAYEPVWAIGTGRTPTPSEIAEVHAAARAKLATLLGDAAQSVRILYGGSVKPGNAAEIFAIDNVDGALVGGASLKAADFLGIIDAAAGV